MHLNDGELRAYQDGEMSVEDQARLMNHLGDCTSCQQRAESLSSQSERVISRLSVLESSESKHTISPQQAHSRLKRRLEFKEMEELSMWQKMSKRVPRPAWVALAIVVILAISVAFAPVRAIASSFLGLFRVEQIRVIEIDPQQLSDQLDSSSQVANLMGDNVQVEAYGELQEVSNAAEASALAGFDARLPTKIDGEPQLSVQPGGKATFNVDMALVEAVLDEMGRSDIKLPSELDGESVTIDVPNVIIAEYGQCSEIVTDNPEGAATPPARLVGNCTTLNQMPSPTISAPPELNINEIGLAYLQLLGMDGVEAKQLANSVDWTTTMIVPIPRYDTEYLEVDVAGNKGTLIYRQGYYPFYLLLWIEDGIIYALRGTGDLDQAMEIANSLE